MPSIKGAAAIVGIGQTEFSKDSGRSELQLCAEAVRAAIADAGLQPADVDGAVTFTIDPNDELNLMRSVGIRQMRWTSRTPFGGGGSSATIEHAAAAVVSGAADVVVVYRAFNERSGRRFGQPMAGPPPPAMNWYLPYGLDTPAKAYSMASATRISGAIRWWLVDTPQPTRTRGTTSVRSRWRTIRPPGGSSNPFSACSTAARRATGEWR
jgi:acetyl-CoA acetyltransferase